MEGKIKVEFEINAVGKETVNGYDDSFKNFEIARVKNLSKTVTLGNLEAIINDLFSEIQSAYEQPEQLTAKIIIREGQNCLSWIIKGDLIQPKGALVQHLDASSQRVINLDDWIKSYLSKIKKREKFLSSYCLVSFGIIMLIFQ